MQDNHPSAGNEIELPNGRSSERERTPEEIAAGAERQAERADQTQATLRDNEVTREALESRPSNIRD